MTRNVKFEKAAADDRRKNIVWGRANRYALILIPIEESRAQRV